MSSTTSSNNGITRMDTENRPGPEFYAAIRSKLYKAMSSAGIKAAYLQGGKSEVRYNTDADLTFRQESNFLYATGVTDADCAALFTVNEDGTGFFHLFVPDHGEAYAVWL